MAKANEEFDLGDGFTLLSTQLDPLKLYPLAPRVAAIVMSVLGGLGELSALGEAGIAALMTDPEGLEKIGPHLVKLTAALGKPENARLPCELLLGCKLQFTDDAGKLRRYDLLTDDSINARFRGRFMLMLKAMWCSAGHNFADFFPGARASAPSKASEPALTATPSD